MRLSVLLLAAVLPLEAAKASSLTYQCNRVCTTPDTEIGFCERWAESETKQRVTTSFYATDSDDKIYLGAHFGKTSRDILKDAVVKAEHESNPAAATGIQQILDYLNCSGPMEISVHEEPEHADYFRTEP